MVTNPLLLWKQERAQEALGALGLQDEDIGTQIPVQNGPHRAYNGLGLCSATETKLAAPGGMQAHKESG